MSEDSPSKLWTQVDRYLSETLVFPDTERKWQEIFEATLARNKAAQLPEIDVAPNQGKLLYMLALLKGAKTILEIGTLGGYSTIWLAKALPKGGRLVSLEFEPKHAEVARLNIERAGLSEVVEIQTGAALDSLAKLHAAGHEPFDLIFIDADKRNSAIYLQWALKLSRPGTLIVCDNVIRDGEVANVSSTDPSVQGTRAMFDILAANQDFNWRLTATAIQTVGSKGYDGFAMALVLGE